MFLASGRVEPLLRHLIAPHNYENGLLRTRRCDVALYHPCCKAWIQRGESPGEMLSGSSGVSADVVCHSVLGILVVPGSSFFS